MKNVGDMLGCLENVIRRLKRICIALSINGIHKNDIVSGIYWVAKVIKLISTVNAQ